MNEDSQIKQTAVLVTCASVLQVMESLFPHPLPGIRFGFANMITLVALFNLGFRSSLEIAVLRTIISSFILGTFLSPGFILSFFAALASTLAMGIIFRLCVISNRPFFSIIGISLMGAVTHNLVQVGLVYLLLIRNKGVFLLLPWMGIGSVIMGWITGVVALQVCQKLAANNKIIRQTEEIGIDRAEPFKSMQYIKLESAVHLLSPVTKITFVFLTALAVLLMNNFYLQTAVFLFLLNIIYLAKIPAISIFSGIRKLILFIFFSFMIPVFFNTGGEILAQAGPLVITRQGLHAGSMFAFRVILLMISASVLVRTTSPEELAEGLSRILSPLEILGISGKRTARIIMLSWASVPDYWEKISGLVRKRNYKGKKLNNLISDLSDLLVNVYRQAEKE